MNTPTEEVAAVVSLLADAADRASCTFDILHVARSGRSVYVGVSNGQSSFLLRISDHRSGLFAKTGWDYGYERFRRVHVGRIGSIRHMLHYFESRSRRLKVE